MAPIEPDGTPSISPQFTCPVRFGRRRADQIGHLVLEPTRLQFRGVIDLNVAWSDVASVRLDASDIVVTLHDSRRVLRFSCHTDLEAARGFAIAERLAGIARADGSQPRGEYHAPA